MDAGGHGHRQGVGQTRAVAANNVNDRGTMLGGTLEDAELSTRDSAESVPTARVRLTVYAGIVAFTLPDDLVFNTQKLAAPAEFARDHEAASWLYLNGEEFASMEGGMSYAQVQEAVGRSLNVITDPPRVLDLELARQHCAALDELPRPTLITCRAGPRASAVSYMYAGLRAGAEPDEVLAAAERAGAPFCKFEDYKEWVATSIATLRREGR